jgi:RNA polymerase sigma factor (sigma-70 family)
MAGLWGSATEILVERFRRERSEASFRALYRAHTPRLSRTCDRLVAGSALHRDDIVQETWLRAVRLIDRFRAQSRFSTWLCGIAVNVVHEGHRRDGGGKLVPLDDYAEDIAAPAIDQLSAIDLDRALAQLPPGYRAAIVLHDIEGYTHEEVAAMLEIAPGTAKSQLSRSRARFRDILGAGATMRKEELP